MRTLKSLVILTLLSMLVAACDSGTGGQATAVPPTSAPAATTAPSGDAITLKVMLVDFVKDKTDKWLTDEVVPAYQKTHPNTKVEFVYVTWGTLDETIQGYFTGTSALFVIVVA